jgi:hypothetical protein
LIGEEYDQTVTLYDDGSKLWETNDFLEDFSIDIVGLLRLLHQRNLTEILIYCLNGDYPYIPAGAASNLNIKIATLSEARHIPSWAQGVFSFE